MGLDALVLLVLPEEAELLLCETSSEESLVPVAEPFALGALGAEPLPACPFWLPCPLLEASGVPAFPPALPEDPSWPPGCCMLLCCIPPGCELLLAALESPPPITPPSMPHTKERAHVSPMSCFFVFEADPFCWTGPFWAGDAQLA